MPLGAPFGRVACDAVRAVGQNVRPETHMKPGAVGRHRRVGKADSRSGKGHDSGVRIPEGDTLLHVEEGTGVRVETHDGV